MVVGNVEEDPKSVGLWEGRSGLAGLLVGDNVAEFFCASVLIFNSVSGLLCSEGVGWAGWAGRAGRAGGTIRLGLGGKFDVARFAELVFLGVFCFFTAAALAS